MTYELKKLPACIKPNITQSSLTCNTDINITNLLSLFAIRFLSFSFVYIHFGSNFVVGERRMYYTNQFVYLFLLLLHYLHPIN